MICPHCGEPIDTRISAATIKRVLVLSKRGYSCREIAAMVGCSFASVARIIRNGKEKL